MESLLDYRFFKAVYESVTQDRDHFYVLNHCLLEGALPPWVPNRKAYIAKPSPEALARYEADPYKMIASKEGPKKMKKSPPKQGFQGVLLHIDANPKIMKGEKQGYITGILNLSPAEESGFNLCSCSTAGCALACLHLSGSPVYQKGKMESRLGNTFYLVKQREKFMDQLISEIEMAKNYAQSVGKKFAVRLNGTSDLPWETPAFGKGGKSLFELFPDVQFYDYTKIAPRMMKHLKGGMQDNYHLTFSYSEKPESIQTSLAILKQGGNVAIAFGPGKGNSREIVPIPKSWNGFPVLDGDETDLRFTDPSGGGSGQVVGLRAKADAAWDYDKIQPHHMEAIAKIFQEAQIKKHMVGSGFSQDVHKMIAGDPQTLYKIIDILRDAKLRTDKLSERGTGFVVQPEDASVDPRQYPENLPYVLTGIEKKLNRVFRGRDSRDLYRQMRKDYYASHSRLYQDFLARVQTHCQQHPEDCEDTFQKIPVAKDNNVLQQHGIGIQPQTLQQIGLLRR